MAPGFWRVRQALQNGSLRKTSTFMIAIDSGARSVPIRTTSVPARVSHHACNAYQVRGFATDLMSATIQSEEPHSPYPFGGKGPSHSPSPSPFGTQFINGPSQATQSVPPEFFSRGQEGIVSSQEEKIPYWTHVPQWDSITPEEFISHRFQVRHTVKSARDLERFLLTVLPESLPASKNPLLQHIKTRDDFIRDARAGLEIASMEVRLTPEILSLVNWADPLDDPIRTQFITLKSGLLPDHPALTLDSLGEKADSPVPGLVHRYPGRALFLATSNCPVYCRYCTRAYMVGPATDSTPKLPQKPSRERWEAMFRHIEKDESIQDIVVSGGDMYQVAPDHLRMIGERLLSIPHIRRFRIASKGLSVHPGRILDKTDAWGSTLIDLSNRGRKMGKQVCWHTHFNHPKEITWIAKKAADHLFKNGVIVRNQSVLQRGVNDDIGTMSALIKSLADVNIQPYYVYQHDLTRSVEDLRTPLKVILKLDKDLRGTLSGFMMPSFVVDLPGGGGKRLASTWDTYDETTGVSTWSAPGLPGEKGQRTYTYYDPRPLPATVQELQKLRRQQDLMHQYNSTQEIDFEKDDEQDETASHSFQSCTA